MTQLIRLCRTGLVPSFCSNWSKWQQVADTAFRPKVSPTAFAAGEGPRVAIDGGHFNFIPQKSGMHSRPIEA
jgi:hypothetical protein